MRPAGTPVGLQLALTSKAVSRAFNDALVAAGGSLPVWLVLSSLRRSPHRAQRDLASSMGITGATLTRHLDNLAQAGLVERVRDPEDRRNNQVELTAAGIRLHDRLIEAAIAFDRRLRTGLSERELATVARALDKLQSNVREDEAGT